MKSREGCLLFPMYMFKPDEPNGQFIRRKKNDFFIILAILPSLPSLNSGNY